MNPNTAPPAPWLSLAIYAVVFASMILWLAPRKGKSRLLALLALIPCLGPFVIIILLSLTDKEVLDEIAELKKRIDQK